MYVCMYVCMCVCGLGVAFAASSRWHSPSWWHMTPHIIRDRVGAIRPDFSVCVEASARPKWSFPVIVAFSLTPGKRKGLGPPFGFSGRRSAAISGSFPLQLGLRREATWLAQNALPFLLMHCSGAHYPLYFRSVPCRWRKGSGGPLLRLLERSVWFNPGSDAPLAR